MEDDHHEWFWALDLDTMIMNGHFRAETLLDNNYDMIVQKDCHWFNAGSFFIRNSKWSRRFLQQVANVTKPDPEFFMEQAAIMVSIKSTSFG
jgi:galactosyl transferase GMA12/MNN10 family